MGQLVGHQGLDWASKALGRYYLDLAIFKLENVCWKLLI